MSAIQSACGRYRYALFLRWAPVPTPGDTLAVIGHNPTFGDETDPAAVRAMLLAASRGYGAVVVLNLFALRTADTKDLILADAAGVDIAGPENDGYLIALTAGLPTVAAWGVLSYTRGRDAFVKAAIPGLRAFAPGGPRHVLFAPMTTGLHPLPA